MTIETVTFSDVQSAAQRLAGQAHRTPVVTSRTFDQIAGCSVFFKCENLQRGGAFKFRGAYNALSQLTPEQRQRGVVAFSSGNHAQGLALAAKVLGIPATVVMPSDAPQIKVEATRGYGAEIVLYDRLTGDREAIARQLASQHGLTVIPPFDHPHIIAGQGTAALELFQDVPDLDVLITPVGGGGLISGCATAAKAMRPAVRVIGVETEPANDAWQSLRSGQRVTIPAPDTIADGIRTTSLGVITFEIMRKLVDEVTLVTDADVIEAMRFMLLRMKLLAEPTGAVPIAALMARKVDGVEGKRVGVIVSGGNADPAMLGCPSKFCRVGLGGGNAYHRAKRQVQEAPMRIEDWDVRWHQLAEDVITGMKEWRLQHPKATYREIETALDERLARVRARMLEDAALVSRAAEWEAESVDHPVCAQCGTPPATSREGAAGTHDAV